MLRFSEAATPSVSEVPITARNLNTATEKPRPLPGVLDRTHATSVHAQSRSRTSERRAPYVRNETQPHGLRDLAAGCICQEYAVATRCAALDPVAAGTRRLRLELKICNKESDRAVNSSTLRMTAVFSFAGFTSKTSASTLRSKTSPLPDASGNCDEPKRVCWRGPREHSQRNAVAGCHR